jgi:hypothetical protein
MTHRIKNLFSIVQGLIGVSEKAARNARCWSMMEMRKKVTVIEKGHVVSYEPRHCLPILNVEPPLGSLRTLSVMLLAFSPDE